MKALDNFSKRIVAAAILFFALATFIFSLSTITPANASAKMYNGKLPTEVEGTTVPSEYFIPMGISAGKAYWPTFNQGRYQLWFAPLSDAEIGQKGW